MAAANPEIVESVDALDPPKQNKKRYWVFPANADRVKHFQQLYETLRQRPERFFSFCRMSIPTFDELLELLRASLTKQSTNLRVPISAEERLLLTLRYLSTGLAFSALSVEFKIARSTISAIIKETCHHVWSVLQPMEMPEPTTEDFAEHAEAFYTKTNFPNCVGAMGGKHINCKSPYGEGFSNYSVVLIAISDANSYFISINVNVFDIESDVNVFKSSLLGKRLYSNELNLPKPKCLPFTDTEPQPFVFVADEAFPLLCNLLRPYPIRKIDENGKIFNERLSQARRAVDCAFGILANKWHIFQRIIVGQSEVASDIIKAACVLHNYVRRRDGMHFNETHEGHLFKNIDRRGTRARIDGQSVRTYFTNYFVGVGALPVD